MESKTCKDCDGRGLCDELLEAAEIHLEKQIFCAYQDSMTWDDKGYDYPTMWEACKLKGKVFKNLS